MKHFIYEIIGKGNFRNFETIFPYKLPKRKIFNMHKSNSSLLS